MTQKEFKDLSNYEKLLKTAETLRYSQGSYGRMYQQLINLDDDTVEQLNNDNTFTNCKDTLDVVMVLEG